MTDETTFGSVAGAGLERTYTTRQGDTLEAIAAYFYGDAKHRQRLIDDNPEFAGLEPAAPVPAGTQLRVSEDPARGDTLATA